MNVLVYGYKQINHFHFTYLWRLTPTRIEHYLDTTVVIFFVHLEYYLIFNITLILKDFWLAWTMEFHASQK